MLSPRPATELILHDIQIIIGAQLVMQGEVPTNFATFYARIGCCRREQGWWEEQREKGRGTEDGRRKEAR